MTPSDQPQRRTRFRDGRGFFEAVYVSGWRLVLVALAVAGAAVVWLLRTHGIHLDTVGWGLLLFALAGLPMGGVTWLLAVATRTCAAVILAVVALTMSPAAHPAYVVAAVLIAASALMAWRSPDKD